MRTEIEYQENLFCVYVDARLFAAYYTREEAQAAIDELRKSHFSWDARKEG